MKVGIIGAGASGLIAAIKAGECGADVTVFEKNEKAGKKLYITGKGRCNVTNAGDKDEFFKNVVNNSRFMYSSFSQFDNFSLMNLIEQLKTPLKVERGNRVFPKSDKSSDIIKALLVGAEKVNAKIVYNQTVKTIKKVENCFKIVTEREEYEVDRVIVATGGITYPSTGSCGDGYIFARKFGHSIIKCVQALVPFECNNILKELQGLSLKNVRLTAKKEGKVLSSEFGEMIFTHFGISGPVVLTMSSYLNRENLSEIEFLLDLKPALSKEQLDARVLRDFEKYKNKQLKNALSELLPTKLIEPIITVAGISLEKQVNTLTHKERELLVSTIKGYRLNVTGLRPLSEAVITSGGVDVIEINPKTMESKIVKGLFFAGEIIDVDALTGGFNLQIAFSTGYVAGENAAL